MAEKTTYELKGALRDECMTNRATLDDFHPLESDWRELMRWLISTSGNIPYYEGEKGENGRLSSLWENHVLTVLVDIIRKDIDGYVDTFVGGRGTSAQQHYTERLKENIQGWTKRLRAFIRQSRGTSPGSPSVEVAELLLSRLENALPKDKEPRRRRFARFPDNANQPYFRMLGTVEDIQKYADEYISRIESGGDMDPSLALLLTFVRNYCGIAERFNRRFREWPAFYRRNILHDTPKEAVQDSTLITIEPDCQGTFPLPAGTAFLAGKKADGSDLLYATTEKAYIVPARLRSVHSLSGKEGRLYVATLPAGGQDAPCPLFDTKNRAASVLEYGWLLTSRSLVLSEGRRTVTVSIRLESGEEGSIPGLSSLNGNTSAFILQLSGGEGWRQKEEYTMEADPGHGILRLAATLDESEEAPVPCTEELHGIATVYPALRILFADREIMDALPHELSIKEITLHTEVDGIRDFTLIGESGQADPSQPFYPFGPTGERGGRLVFGHEEAALKKTTSVTLKGTWTKLPGNGFRPIYEHYGLEKPIDGNSFTVRLEWQEGSRWHECAASPQPLFRMDGAGKLTDEAVFELALEEKTTAGAFRSMPYRRDSNGFYRLILDSPETGFGTNTYYRRFTEVMMHNGRKKEKNRLPVPEQPPVPMLCDMTFGYRSAETLASGGGGGLYRFSGLSGYEACALQENRLPIFYPHMEPPAILLNLDHIGDASRVRLYLGLRYAMRGGMPVTGQPDCTLRVSRYAGGGAWKELPSEDILCEETEGLTRSGFIELKVREEAEGRGLWLKFSFAGNASPENMVLEGIYLNCVRVRATGGDGNPLPVGTPVSPTLPDGRILSVTQIQPGSGGRPAETEAQAGVRQRIRTATRGRAICGTDYEQLILERFPEVEKACCVPACDGREGIRIVVFPKPEAKSYPFLPGWKLSEMERSVRGNASPFARIKVVNPVYEPVDVYFSAMLKKDTRDPGEVKRRMERRICTFLMGWYMAGILPDLGVRYSRNALLSRIGNDERIERVGTLKVTGENREWKPDAGDDIFYGATDSCGVLYVRNLTVELEDYRSGVDESRIGSSFVIG